MTDLERAIAVIADLCGAGYPGVKETKEELAEWAEEFVERYFDKPKICYRCDGDVDDPYCETTGRLLMEAADFIGSTLAQPADERAWWHLLAYCPAPLLADFMQARVHRRIEEIRRGEQ